MATLADKFREEAAEYRTAANALIGAEDILTRADKLVPAIVGHVHANTLEALAELTNYIHFKDGMSGLTVQRKAIIDRSEAIRKAAAIGATTGDWSEFDKLSRGAPTGDTASGTTQPVTTVDAGGS